MTLAKRIIPASMSIKYRVVKGVRFVGHHAGDPVEIAPLQRAGRGRDHLSRHHRQQRQPRHYLTRWSAW